MTPERWSPDPADVVRLRNLTCELHAPTPHTGAAKLRRREFSHLLPTQFAAVLDLARYGPPMTVPGNLDSFRPLRASADGPTVFRWTLREDYELDPTGAPDMRRCLSQARLVVLLTDPGGTVLIGLGPQQKFSPALARLFWKLNKVRVVVVQSRRQRALVDAYTAELRTARPLRRARPLAARLARRAKRKQRRIGS